MTSVKFSVSVPRDVWELFESVQTEKSTSAAIAQACREYIGKRLNVETLDSFIDGRVAEYAEELRAAFERSVSK